MTARQKSRSSHQRGKRLGAKRSNEWHPPTNWTCQLNEQNKQAHSNVTCKYKLTDQKAETTTRGDCVSRKEHSTTKTFKISKQTCIDRADEEHNQKQPSFHNLTTVARNNFDFLSMASSTVCDTAFVERFVWNFKGSVCKNSVLFADVDGDGDNEVIVGGLSGFVHFFVSCNLFLTRQGIGHFQRRSCSSVEILHSAWLHYVPHCWQYSQYSFICFFTAKFWFQRFISVFSIDRQFSILSSATATAGSFSCSVINCDCLWRLGTHFRYWSICPFFWHSPFPFLSDSD